MGIEKKYDKYMKKNNKIFSKTIKIVDNSFRTLFVIMTTIFFIHALMTDNIYLYVVTTYAAFASLFIIINWVEGTQ